MSQALAELGGSHGAQRLQIKDFSAQSSKTVTAGGGPHARFIALSP